MLKKIFLTLVLGGFANGLLAQSSITIKVVSKENKEAIMGASVYVKNTIKGATTDNNGFAEITGIQDGRQTIVTSFVGFVTIEKTLLFPAAIKNIIIELQEDEEMLDVVEISSTRSKRTIAEIPTRVEVIGAEELGEKAVMNSANISMLLRESTGIQMQQTSANSASQSIRIQGLDGRFTQLLKDGFPLFGGFSSGLSIMQIPPLDLKQVEIIKGSSSTLYGGGAIAGLINLISKAPKKEKEFKMMLDITSRKGNTLNAYYSERFGKFGMVLFATGNIQKPTDVNNDHFTDIPKVRSVSFNPSFYYYPTEKKHWRLSFSGSLENRTGGDTDAVSEKIMIEKHPFLEENKSERLAMKLSYSNEISELKSFNFKNSISYFKRDLQLLDYQFVGNQISTFTEATFNTYSDHSDWVFGTNLIMENFKEDTRLQLDRSSKQITFGGFTQNNWSVRENVAIETGVRADYNQNYGLFILPRVSLFFQLNEATSTRIGTGFGYKIPSIFTEDVELRSYKNVLNIDPNNFKAETSVGFNADVNYKTTLFDNAISVSFNQLFFYTILRNSLVLEQQNTDYVFLNASNPLNSYGFETNLRFKYKDFVLFTNYAFNNVKLNNQQKILTPKHNLGGVLMYEVHDKWRIGYEAYYKSSQLRSNLTKTPGFWTMGLMAMRTFKKISIYANFENFTDTKQSNYQSMITLPHTNPTFTDIWAPTDGFVFNTGILFKI